MKAGIIRSPCPMMRSPARAPPVKSATPAIFALRLVAGRVPGSEGGPIILRCQRVESMLDRRNVPQAAILIAAIGSSFVPRCAVHLPLELPTRRCKVRGRTLNQELVLRTRDQLGGTMTSRQLMGFMGTMVFVACILPAQAQQAPDPRVAELVQSGKLRVALGLAVPYWP